MFPLVRDGWADFFKVLKFQLVLGNSLVGGD